MLAIINDIFSIPFVRLIAMIFFFLFIYKLLYRIFEFFGIRYEIRTTYLIWIAVVIMLLTFLPHRESNLYDF